MGTTYNTFAHEDLLTVRGSLSSDVHSVATLLTGQFCRHAKGQLEEVVQEAIRKGFRVYGLSEHVPRYRVEDLYPEEVILIT